MSGTAKHSSKRLRVMEVAARRFSTHGYANTRMTDIAADLEMKAGSLYYYFESKEALLAALIESNVGLATESLQQIAASEGTAPAKVRAAVESHLTVFAEQPDLYTIFVSEKLHTVAPELAEKVDAIGRRYEALWVDVIREGVSAGELRSDLDPWVAMKATVGLCNSMLFWFSTEGRIKPVELAESFSSLILEGLVASEI